MLCPPEEYLVHVAKTGYTEFPWAKVRALFKVGFSEVLLS